MTHLQQIGPIPDWIKSMRGGAYDSKSVYLNVFELLDPPTIYGTEHLLGDWRGGELLLLAKDFTPADTLMDLMDRNPGLRDEQIYRYNDGDGRYGRTGLLTNRSLLRSLYGDDAALDGHMSQSSRAVYGSICFFLKPKGTSARLKNFRLGREAFDGSLNVVRYAISNMPKIKAVICLGKDASQAIATACTPSPKRTPEICGVPVLEVPHPAARPSNVKPEEKINAWREVRTKSGCNWLACRS
jgi:hypothetical protein